MSFQLVVAIIFIFLQLNQPHRAIAIQPQKLFLESLPCLTDSCVPVALQIGSITTTGHSLGGALAALCAFDIADCLEQYPARKTVNQRREALQESRIKAEGVRLSEQAFDILDNAQGAFNKAGLSKDANKMYIHTQEAIDSFCEKVLEPGEDIIPVTAVTFGAPRVGDISFARKFGDPRCVHVPKIPTFPILITICNRIYWFGFCFQVG